MGVPGIVPGIEQKYPYGEYGQESGIGRLCGLTVQPRIEGPERVGGGQPAGPQRVAGENGEQIAYTDNRGYVGLSMEPASPLTGGQAGYKEKPGFIPKELCVA